MDDILLFFGGGGGEEANNLSLLRVSHHAAKYYTGPRGGTHSFYRINRLNSIVNESCWNLPDFPSLWLLCPARPTCQYPQS
jgi:hypothetical protein